jgi:hypothetical protein
MNVKELLVAVKAKLEDPDHWCKNAAARNKHGVAVLASDADACSWCMTGAISVVAGEDYDDARYREARYLLLEAIKDVTGLICITTEFNDAPNRLHRTVMQVLDRAIEIA